jgi:hypothetical protein
MDWNSINFEMQYPHWLMAAGDVLVVVGSVGSAFQKNAKQAKLQGIAPRPERSYQRPRLTAAIGVDVSLCATRLGT